MKYVGIIPLIGGMDLAHGAVFGQRPEYLVSWTPFHDNDEHLVNYYGDVQYHVVDDPESKKRPHRKINIVHSTCPCAGLSMLSRTAGADNPKNDWMVTCAEYVMGEMKPDVYWGENAPALASKMGEPVREKIKAAGKRHGYTMSVYRTKSLLHGVPQIRERTFYFFWKGTKAPILNYFRKDHQPIEDLIAGCKSNFQTEPVRKGKPTEDPYYRYVLEVLHGGMKHREYAKSLEFTTQMLEEIEKTTTFPELGKWFKKEGYEREAAFCERTQAKLDAGGGIMRRSLIIPKDYIGAFVGHLPSSIVHPTKDRYLSYRECMDIMGLPSDFELLHPKKRLNHVCQNVPLQTATDLAGEVKAALSDERPWVETDYLFQSNHHQRHEFKGFDGVENTVEEIFA